MNHSKIIVTLLVIISIGLLNFFMINLATAGQKIAKEKNQINSNRIYGKVTNVTKASNYTYVEVDNGKEKAWAASRATSVKIGDMIAFSTSMPVKNFHSKVLKRDFPVIYFVDGFNTDANKHVSNTAKIASLHGHGKKKTTVAAIKGIKKVKGGKTIAEIYAQQKSLGGKRIRVRGKVTKFNAEIMGKNWLHIRDSSTLNDLTVTTKGKAAVGDVVILEGKLGLNKDFSYGYVYPVIMEEARITKE